MIFKVLDQINRQKVFYILIDFDKKYPYHIDLNEYK